MVKTDKALANATTDLTYVAQIKGWDGETFQRVLKILVNMEKQVIEDN